MTRILSGGGKDANSKPTTKTIGRPGFPHPTNSDAPRRGVRKLSKSDPADAVISVPIGTIPYIGMVKAALTTALTGTNNDLIFTAKMAGPVGNNIRVRYVVSGLNTPLSVSVSVNDITVNVATDGAGAATSTANSILAAVNADATAKTLVTASLAAANDGTGVVTALAFTNLTGGTNGTSRAPLPPDLAAAPPSPTIIGHEETAPTQVKPTDPSVIQQQKFGDVRVRDRSVNRRIRKS